MSLQQANASTGQTRSQPYNYGTEGALKLRLDTKELLLDIERDLRGEIIVSSEDEEGIITTKRITIGEKKANDRGVQAILKFLKSCINTSGVQGNFDEKQYKEFIFYKRIELTKRLWINLNEFEIDVKGFEGIVDDCINLVELVVSRTINNLERESYNQTIKHSESATVESKKGLMPF